MKRCAIKMSDIQSNSKQNLLFPRAKADSGIELINNAFSPMGFVVAQ